MSTFGGYAYDALYMVVDALKAVGPDKAKIRDYLETKLGTGRERAGSSTCPPRTTRVKKDAFEMIVVKNGDWTFAD